MKTLDWMLKHARDVIIILLVVLIVLQRECTPKPKPCPEYKDSTSVTVHIDTIKVPGKTVYYPVPYKVVEIDTFFAEKPADTASILLDWVKSREYKLETSDSNGKIHLFARVQFNKLAEYTWDKEFFKNTVYVYTEHTERVQPKNKVYAGFGVGGWSDKFGAEASLGLNTKRDHLYTASIDPFNKFARVNTFWVIRFKK